MATPAYKVIDRRGTSGGGANWMVDAARPNLDRQRIPLQDRDFHRNITSYGRRRLRSVCRWMFWNIPALQGAILEQANLAVSSFLPQYFGDDKEWGDQAENWLFNWHKIFDIAGPPMNRRTWLRFLIVTQFTDGGMGTLLTGVPSGNDPLGYPMIQTIPAHRIRSQHPFVEGGQFDGARIIDGVIVNDYGRALAYRVYGEGSTGAESDDYQDIPARDMFLTYDPMAPGQVRELPLLASSVFNFQDSAEFDRFEMLAQKAFSAHTLLET